MPGQIYLVLNKCTGTGTGRQQLWKTQNTCTDVREEGRCLSVHIKYYKGKVCSTQEADLWSSEFIGAYLMINLVTCVVSSVMAVLN